MRAEDIGQLVAHHPVLEGLPGETASLVAGCARNIALETGEHFVVEGEPANTIYLIRRGRVSLELRTPNREPLVIDVLGPGSAVGWSWLFPPYRWRFDVHAIEPVGAIAVDAECFRTKMEADPAFGYAVMERFATIILDRLRAALGRLVDLCGKIPAGG